MEEFSTEDPEHQIPADAKPGTIIEKPKSKYDLEKEEKDKEDYKVNLEFDKNYVEEDDEEAVQAEMKTAREAYEKRKGSKIEKQRELVSEDFKSYAAGDEALSDEVSGE